MRLAPAARPVGTGPPTRGSFGAPKFSRRGSEPDLNRPVSPSSPSATPATSSRGPRRTERSPGHVASRAFGSPRLPRCGSAGGGLAHSPSPQESPSTSMSPAPRAGSSAQFLGLGADFDLELQHLENENYALRERTSQCEGCVADRRNQCNALSEELWLLLELQGRRSTGEQRLRSTSRRLDLAKRQLECQRQAAVKAQRDLRDAVRRLEAQGDHLRRELRGARSDLDQLEQRSGLTERELQRLEREQADSRSDSEHDELINALMISAEQLRNEEVRLEGERCHAEVVTSQTEACGHAEIQALRQELQVAELEEEHWAAVLRKAKPISIPHDDAANGCSHSEIAAAREMVSALQREEAARRPDREVIEAQMAGMHSAFESVEEGQLQKDDKARRLEAELRRRLHDVLEETASHERQAAELHAKLRRWRCSAILADMEMQAASGRFSTNGEVPCTADEIAAMTERLSVEFASECMRSERGAARLEEAREANASLWRELSESKHECSASYTSMASRPQNMELCSALEVLRRIYIDKVENGARAKRQLKDEVWRMQLARDEMLRARADLQAQRDTTIVPAEELVGTGLCTGAYTKLPTVHEDDY